MHDYGHLSVFKSSKLNHIVQNIAQMHIKGASSKWWNFRHHQHHVKVNVYKKDPDVTFPIMFLIGDLIAEHWGRMKKGIMPYKWQHIYFYLR